MTRPQLIPVHYATLLSTSDGRRLAAGGLIGRSGFVGLSLAVLLYVKQESESFATAGLLAAAVTGGAAPGRLIHAHLVERYSARPVLVASSLVSPVLLAVFLLAVGSHAETWKQICLAASVGFAVPALPPLARVLWGKLAAPSERSTYHGFEQIVTETSFIAGPLIAGVLAGSAGPLFACCICGMLSSTGGLIVSSTSVAAQETSDLRTGPGSILNGLAPFALVMSLGGIAGGLTEVAITAFAVDLGQTGMSGVLLAVWGIGAVIGGLLLGSRMRHSSLLHWLVASLTFLSISVLPAALVGTTPILALVLLIHGLAIVPTWGAFWALIEDYRGTRRLGHVFAALYMSSSVGIAIGIAAGGWLVGSVSPHAPFLLAAISYLALAIVSYFMLRPTGSPLGVFGPPESGR